MSHLCDAPGCTNAAARPDRFCSAHRTRLSRYGHPLQRAVTSRDLEPFACRIASRLPEDGEVRVMMKERWSSLLASVASIRATGIFTVPFGGPSADRPATPTEREAARRFLATASSTSSREVADIVVGLAILRAVTPDAFEDHTAFRFILARRFLGLSTTNAAKNRPSGSTTYRTFPAALMLTVADWLWSVFGEVAEKMADAEVVEIARADAERERLRQALAAL